ncbi:hydroxyethylthiazole kinase [Pseudobutyrivibrio xylanivorans]|uniref:Hydroxyethylthiazole kinase n=1 Tax=Pseudobutyrivibrio xylanivorans TaxID=185007 RepID=A0A5P6VME3_PSEXY|nr:hydroxyethylthiazole kinase [Pseudobutyrivibrio xylanivorans]QFJ53823.1 hydroxyethylthiazole kinase [Pseudobutyrivibrio xylanivorans]
MERENRKPLIHCITNPIAMNQSANTILALGARPIMAEHPLEVEEITETADALLLNLGNISDTRMEAMEKAIAVANAKGIPVVLDAVGVACSGLRRNFAKQLIIQHKCRVIKGNYSELMALYDDSYRSSGVDAGQDISVSHMKDIDSKLAEQYKCIILSTGKTDLISYEGKVISVEGGCAELSSVTGTGCMLGAIIATGLAFDNSPVSVEKACRFFKSCGVKARTDKGSGTFMVNLLDKIGEKDGF